jgi:hypothetical protein
MVHILCPIISPDNLNTSVEIILYICIEIPETCKHLFHKIYPSHPRVTINEGDKILYSTNRDHMTLKQNTKGDVLWSP